MYRNALWFKIYNSYNKGLTIDDILIMVLMYADDTAILSETPEGVVFRKRGRLRQHEQWSYNDESLETFNYLGTVYSNNGKFSSNQQMLVGKALKAMNCLLYNLKTFDFTAKCKCQLFDAFVSSILMYSCEVWGGCIILL